MITKFLIYGLSGWCIEIVWTGLGALLKGDKKLQARTYLWMFPIYGLAVFLEPIHDFIRSQPILIRGGIYTILIFFLEYTTGWLIKKITGLCPWDYSCNRFSVKGFIRLDYTPAWFIAGLLFERLHDFLNKILPYLKP